jgi:hypothetical protein
MKTLKIIVSVLGLFLAISLQAQVTVNVNVGTPPAWGPAENTQVRYYYLPDVEAYYDVPSAQFIYYSGGLWVHRKYLPSRYKSYDLYGGYKVVMSDYHGSAPYTHFKEHKMKYAKGYHGHPQKTIGEKPGQGHSNDKGNPGNIKTTGKGNPKGMNKSPDKGNPKGMSKSSGKGGGKGHKK